MQHNEILHVGDIARITEKEVLQLSLHVAIVTYTGTPEPLQCRLTLKEPRTPFLQDMEAPIFLRGSFRQFLVVMGYAAPLVLLSTSVHSPEIFLAVCWRVRLSRS